MSKESAMAAYVHEMKKVAQEVFFFTSLLSIGRSEGETLRFDFSIALVNKDFH